jgi:hypothetical protein
VKIRHVVVTSGGPSRPTRFVLPAGRAACVPVPLSTPPRPGAECICAFQILQQADAGTDRPVGKLLQSLAVLRRPMTAVHSIAEVIMGFSQRRFGDPRVSSELGMTVAGESFGEVARSRRGGILDLLAKLKIIASRGLINKCVHLQLQFVCKLPGNEFFISPHSHDQCAGNARAAHPAPRHPTLRHPHQTPSTWHSTRHPARSTLHRGTVIIAI